jgi:hypothetical protein
LLSFNGDSALLNYLFWDDLDFYGERTPTGPQCVDAPCGMVVLALLSLPGRLPISKLGSLDSG